MELEWTTFFERGLAFPAAGLYTGIVDVRDEFLSEEDLDLATLSMEELIAYWNFWLEQAQATNEEDRDLYSHGVFTSYPPGRA